MLHTLSKQNNYNIGNFKRPSRLEVTPLRRAEPGSLASGPPAQHQRTFRDWAQGSQFNNEELIEMLPTGRSGIRKFRDSISARTSCYQLCMVTVTARSQWLIPGDYYAAREERVSMQGPRSLPASWADASVYIIWIWLNVKCACL